MTVMQVSPYCQCENIIHRTQATGHWLKYRGWINTLMASIIVNDNAINSNIFIVDIPNVIVLPQLIYPHRIL